MSAHEKTAAAPRVQGERNGRSNTADSTRPGLFPRPVTDADRARAERVADRLDWMTRAERAAWELIADGHDFDAHAITETVGRPFPGDGRNLAAIIRRHHRAGHIERADYQRTRRPTSGAVVAVWRATGRGRRVAARRLADQGAA